MPSSWQRVRGDTLQSRVFKFDDGGMCLMAGGQRTFIPWSMLGLSEAPEGSVADRRALRWRLHCVDPGSGTKEFYSGDSNHWTLRALQDRGVTPQAIGLRTGVLEVVLRVELRALLSLVAARSYQAAPLRLNLAEPFSICLEHRQPWDKGACCLCSQGLARSLKTCRPCQQFESPEMYASRWGAMIELEAAASAIESNDSRFLCNVCIRWEPPQPDGCQRGSFDVPVSLARAHKLKFRGLLARGGESASSWLCMRETDAEGGQQAAWSGHARVVAAGILGEGEQLGLDDEDNLKSMDGRRSITVVFEVLPEVSDRRAPTGEFFFVEYVQKALSHSMAHMALAEVNAATTVPGIKPRPLLARDVVLGRLPLNPAVDPANLSHWKLNDSQDQAVRRALARPLTLVHGPPGTGKTRTAAILMTQLAQRNLGSRCAILFAAPTNKACDAALYSTNKLCQGHFAERLRARLQEDGDEECAICLSGAPDIVTACGHVFHRACVARALEVSSKCPICRQVLKQHGGGLRVLRVFGADSEREDFPVPRPVDHKGIQTFKAQSVPVEMRRFTLHWRCHAAVDDEEPSAEALRTRDAYQRLRSLNVKSAAFANARDEYYEALEAARAVEVHQSDIIFTTCVSARRLALVAALEAEGAPEVRQVVLDEAGQAPEPEALCPLAIARHARQAIFFGDHKQLRPILRSKIAEDAGLGISLFERLATQDWGNRGEGPVSLLAQQYRMHPSISSFPCWQFYAGRIRDDCSVLSRPPGLLVHPGTRKQAAVLLWDGAGQYGSGQEQLQQVRTVAAGGVGSRCNVEEARRAAGLAADLARAAGAKSVAVLSWYNSQVAKVSELLRKSGNSGVHVGSIATAQGSEWDYVILSAVRSETGGGGLGLVADAHNLNVALTRAKLGLVVLCDGSAVMQDSNWRALLDKCTSEGSLVYERPVVQPSPTSDGGTAAPAPGPLLLQPPPRSGGGAADRSRPSPAELAQQPPPPPPPFAAAPPFVLPRGPAAQGCPGGVAPAFEGVATQAAAGPPVDHHRQIAAMLRSQIFGCKGPEEDGVCDGCNPARPGATLSLADGLEPKGQMSQAPAAPCVPPTVLQGFVSSPTDWVRSPTRSPSGFGILSLGDAMSPFQGVSSGPDCASPSHYYYDAAPSECGWPMNGADSPATGSTDSPAASPVDAGFGRRRPPKGIRNATLQRGGGGGGGGAAEMRVWRPSSSRRERAQGG